MKKNISRIAAAFAGAAMMLFAAACSDFEPKGLPEVGYNAPATDLTASNDGFDVVLNWALPNDENIEGVRLTIDGGLHGNHTLEGRATTYTAVGQPMDIARVYTVKVIYSTGAVSEGISIEATVPYVKLPDVTSLTANSKGRTVSLSWTLPTDTKELSAVKVILNGNEAAATMLEPTATSCTLKGQPMGKTNVYTVALVYNGVYASEGVDASVEIPYIKPKMGYLLTASSAAALPDDDERAAAAWFAAQEDAEFIFPDQLAELDADICPVLWIEIDRVGLPAGWQNLPESIVSDEAIAALKQYSANGGSLYLANMATQLTVPLGFVPDNMAPTVYGNGTGGTGTDVWVINPYLGWDFRDGGDQGFYDRTEHAIFKDLVMEDPNGYGYNALPLIGPGQREDHNCLWDCNLYGKGSQPDVIRNFEVTTGSLVLATWGHVRDHCVAGLVEFNATPVHGRCVANGLAAYEWNQNSGANIYQHNVEQLTSNILNYLK